MPEAKAAAGLMLDWGREHRDGKGRLISREMMVFPPDPISCIKPSCFFRYTLKTWRYMLILLYHQRRLEYAEKHRNDTMPEHYRTGEKTPESFMGLITETLKLLWKT